ncbi:MAG TPA: 1,4-dihydroxy-2-naphthoate octaprenyltransferase [Parachlamydiaceae bacterium]|nr:1,4-dihydroxy-2-naphthoate octaprenyltransferase [Parachlamydiaceae bacterium]
MKNTPNIIQAWATAARLRTLPIPTIQVLTGTCLAYSVTGTVDWLMLLFTWLVSIFITMATNLLNDVIDFEKAVDHKKPVGYLKVISAGLIPKEHVRMAGYACLALVVLFAIPLALNSGWMLFGIILISVVCSYAYTGGPYPISYLGLSELFILFFYGFVCVGASYYIQTGSVTEPSLLCALQMGLLAILPNALNNFRDMHEDAENNKLTLAVRFGKTFARWEIAILTFLPYFLGIAWLFFGYVNAALFPLLSIPMAFVFVRGIWTTDPGPSFNRFFGLSVLVHFLFGLLLVIGFLFKDELTLF